MISVDTQGPGTFNAHSQTGVVSDTDIDGGASIPFPKKEACMHV
jgi:hypothetical protein